MATVQQWKERRGDELRDLILNAASRVFNEKGFERSTTKEVAREIGIAEGTIYNYFVNKRDLLLSLVKRFADTASGLFHERLSDEIEGPENLQGFAARYFLERLELFREGLSPTLVFYYAKRDPEVRDILESFWAATLDKRLRPQLDELKEAGVLRDIDLDFLGAFFRAIVFGLATMMDVDPPSARLHLSLEEMSHMARDVIWHGLAATQREVP